MDPQRQETSVVLSWTGSDGGSGVDHYLYSTDGGLTWTSTTATELTLAGLADGAVDFRIKAVDLFGNESPVTRRNWTVDTVVPSVTIELVDNQTEGEVGAFRDGGLRGWTEAYARVAYNRRKHHSVGLC